MQCLSLWERPTVEDSIVKCLSLPEPPDCQGLRCPMPQFVRTPDRRGLRCHRLCCRPSTPMRSASVCQNPRPSGISVSSACVVDRRGRCPEHQFVRTPDRRGFRCPVPPFVRTPDSRGFRCPPPVLSEPPTVGDFGVQRLCCRPSGPMSRASVCENPRPSGISMSSASICQNPRQSGISVSTACVVRTPDRRGLRCPAPVLSEPPTVRDFGVQRLCCQNP